MVPFPASSEENPEWYARAIAKSLCVLGKKGEEEGGGERG